MNPSEELLSLRSLHNVPTVELLQSNGEGKAEIEARIANFNAKIEAILNGEELVFSEYEFWNKKRVIIKFKATSGNDALRIGRDMDFGMEINVSSISSKNEIILTMAMEIFDKVVGVLRKLEVVKPDDGEDDNEEDNDIFVGGQETGKIAVVG